MRKRAAAPVLLSISFVSGCVVQNGEAPLANPTPVTTTRPGVAPLGTSSPATATPTTTQAATTAPTALPTTPPPPTVACDKPSKALLDWAALSIAASPGPVTASAVVYAATTPTGRWYVIGIDRADVRDNGTLAGGYSRSLGLTDVVNRRGKNSKLIPLGGEVKGKLKVTWDHVSWDGATLAAGKAAVAQAIACLDADEAASGTPTTGQP